MVLAVVLIVMLALPLLVSYASRLVRHEWEQIAEQRRTVRPSLVPIERVGADLRRLRAQLEARENRPGVTGKGMKMRAVRTAYLQVLTLACDQLDVRPPQRLGQLEVPLAEIYRVEVELRGRGLDVRPPQFPQQSAA
ncbi:MAG TPA: hypothetical protein VJ851_18480 [Jatrophihabitans sp.]|nr:hypothetical protein [Jatrophihabitans sp.]